MIKITRTVTLDGKTNTEYQAIIKHLEETNSTQAGWTLHKEPLIHRVTAHKTEEVTEL